VKEEFAPVVFGNAAPTVLAAMLPDSKRAPFMARYKNRRLSLSLWTIALGLSRQSRDFGVKRYSTAVLPAWLTAISRYREAAAILGEDPATRITPYGFVAYDQIESGLNENSPFLASLVGLDRIENWAGLSREAKRARKERWMDRIVADLDLQYPGIASAIVQREMSTAETFHQYLNTPDGALYGFAPESRGLMPLAETAIVPRVGVYRRGRLHRRHSGWRVGRTSGSESRCEARNTGVETTRRSVMGGAATSVSS